MTDELHFKTVAELARLIETRAISPVELTEQLLARIATFDSQLDAFITVTAELAREQAKQAESEIMAGRYRGPLHGIPFALKDIYNTRGILTTGGSKICVDNVPGADATTFVMLRDAGSVLLGKLQTHEFAHGGPSFDLPWPPSRNPWNLEHFTAGSSSGAGAALAAGLIPAALGSDTGGSIRGPASHCGVAGLKPTAGLVSRAGVMPNSFTLDYCGPMARSAEDCAMLLQAIAGFDGSDPASANHAIPDYRSALAAGVKGLRIGVLRHYWEEDTRAHPDLARAMEEAIATFAKLGAQVEDCRTEPLQRPNDVKIVIAETELFAIHHPELVKRPGDFGIDFLGRVLPACLFQSHDYLQASREHRRIVAAMRPLYERYDVLLTSGFGPAPRLDAHRIVNFWLRPQVFAPANLTGGPALVLPCGFSNGLPLGLQIVGRPFADDLVLRVGHAYQQATDWHLRRPQLVAGAPQPQIAAGKQYGTANVDAAMRNFVEQTAARAGLRLNEEQMNVLLEAAPHAIAMAARLREPRDRFDAPSLVFRLDD